jgi:hypothetical protein
MKKFSKIKALLRNRSHIILVEPELHSGVALASLICGPTLMFTNR